MKKGMETFVLASVVFAIFGIGLHYAHAGIGDESSLTSMNPFLKRGYAHLGLTESQISAAKAIVKKNLPELQTMTNQFVAERRVLKTLMRAEPVNETAIRAQVAKIALLGADLCVKRAVIRQEICRTVLTPDQLKKAENARLFKEKRTDRYMARTFMWYAE
jgi:periplasmic protein CpxP/Spy